MYTVFSVAYTMSELALTAMHNPTEDKVQPTADKPASKGTPRRIYTGAPDPTFHLYSI